MKNGDLKKYLDEFKDDAEVSMVLTNPKERKLYEVEDILVVTGENNPILCICVGKESEMDEELQAAVEEDERHSENLPGQMDITDYPEVMP